MACVPVSVEMHLIRTVIEIVLLKLPLCVPWCAPISCVCMEVSMRLVYIDSMH